MNIKPAIKQKPEKEDIKKLLSSNIFKTHNKRSYLVYCYEPDNKLGYVCIRN
jgi:hypothetical protein